MAPGGRFCIHITMYMKSGKPGQAQREVRVYIPTVRHTSAQSRAAPLCYWSAPPNPLGKCKKPTANSWPIAHFELHARTSSAFLPPVRSRSSLQPHRVQWEIVGSIGTVGEKNHRISDIVEMCGTLSQPLPCVTRS